MDYTIVNTNEIPVPGHNWKEREDIKAILMSIPEDGKAICVEIPDKRQRNSDVQLLRGKILRKRLGVIISVRGSKVYLFKGGK